MHPIIQSKRDAIVTLCQRYPRAFLGDVLDATTALDEFIARATFENYADTRLLRSGVERQLEIVGEALS